MNDYDYVWDGIGITISTPYGDCYLQGEEANELYDELEAVETDEQIATILSEYDHICE